MVVKISFPSIWEEVTEIEDGNIDVFVELDDGYTYTVVVATAKNIEYLMDKEKMNYFGPGHPFIIVKELTKDIIEETLKAYAEEYDGYGLKLYHFAGKINKTVFDQLQAEHIEYLKELDEVKELNESDKEFLKEDLKKIEELNGLDNS
jgi:hypothetical protein